MSKSPPQYNADIYDSSRPIYPFELFKLIKTFHGQDEIESALDVGCGTGLSTRGLSSYLRIPNIIGIDPSENMISQARLSADGTSVIYRMGNAEEITNLFGEVKFDLITAGECAHWFDMKLFYEQVYRTLRPGGTLAIFSYCHFSVEDFPSILARVIHFTQEILKPFWDERRPRLDRLYIDPDFLESPFSSSLKRAVYDGNENPYLMKCEFSIFQIRNYISSWSAYKNLKETSDGIVDPLDDLISFIKKETNVIDDHQKLPVVFQMVVILGKKS